MDVCPAVRRASPRASPAGPSAVWAVAHVHVVALVKAQSQTFEGRGPPGPAGGTGATAAGDRSLLFDIMVSYHVNLVFGQPVCRRLMYRGPPASHTA
jgi:hypothetical protein